MRVWASARCAGLLCIYFLTLTSCDGHLKAAARSVFKPEDFVVVINTEQARLQLALASRPLRSGLRTFIAVDNATLAEELNRSGHLHNETYAHFPNRNVRGPERSKPGDTRWQAAPFMAHHHFGPTYKWMLLGDDDTLWFMLGVKRLLYGYDHNLPYALSDHLGDHNARGFFVPSPLAAVCSPCHWPDLLRAHHREDLLPYSSAVLTNREATSWDPRELDGWGAGRTQLQNRPAAAGAAGGGSATAAAGVAAGSTGGGGKRPWRGARAQRWRATQAIAGNSTQQQQRPQQQPLKAPLWGKRGQEPINMSAVLEVAYYSTAPGFDAPVAAAAATAEPLPPPVPPPGCPCRPAQGCLHRARVCRGRGRGQELCGRALVYKVGFRGSGRWCRHSWAHGGAGVMLSVGLLAATAGGPMEACARATQVHSCDMNLAMCLMDPALGLPPAPPGAGCAGGAAADAGSGNTKSSCNRSSVGGGGGGGGGAGGERGSEGFMFTHPGSAALRGANWADPRFILFDNPVFQRVLHDPVGFLEGRVTCSREARAAAIEVVAAFAAGAAAQGDPAEAEDEEGLDGGGGEAESGDLRRQGAGKGEGSVGAEGEARAGDTAVMEGGHGVVVRGAAEAADVGRGDGGTGGIGRRVLTAAGGGMNSRAAAASAAAEGGDLASAQTLGSKARRAAGVSRKQKQSARGRGRQEAELDIKDDGAICDWLVRHAVSLHMHGRSYPSYDDAARAMASVVRHHMHAMHLLRELPDIWAGYGFLNWTRCDVAAPDRFDTTKCTPECSSLKLCWDQHFATRLSAVEQLYISPALVVSVG